MAVEPGLPLGLIADAMYAETHCRLAPNDRLTFVSDGVVEATNSQGELYGFARRQAISAEPAERVAQAAQAFGQEDDITVLSVIRIGALEPALT
jgi:serine phosphatase RsbU (regulator of sigma subunit)